MLLANGPSSLMFLPIKDSWAPSRWSIVTVELIVVVTYANQKLTISSFIEPWVIEALARPQSAFVSRILFTSFSLPVP